MKSGKVFFDCLGQGMIALICAASSFAAAQAREPVCAQGQRAKVCVGESYYLDFSEELVKVVAISSNAKVVVQFLSGTNKDEVQGGKDLDRFFELSKENCSSDGSVCKKTVYYDNRRHTLIEVVEISSSDELIVRILVGAEAGQLFGGRTAEGLEALSKARCTVEKHVCQDKVYYDKRTDDLVRVVAISANDHVVVEDMDGHDAGRVVGDRRPEDLAELLDGQDQTALVKALTKLNRMAKAAKKNREERESSSEMGTGGASSDVPDRPAGRRTKGVCPSNWTFCPTEERSRPLQIPAHTRDGEIVYIDGHPFVYHGD
jgi:hypothetical protein